MSRLRLSSSFLVLQQVTLLLAAMLCLVSCQPGEKADDESLEILRSPETAAVSPEAGASSLPQSGQITTSTPGAVPANGQQPQALTPEQQAKVLDLMMNRLADRQSKGLGGGKITVHAAWKYDGYSYLSPNPASEIRARMVAIDLTVKGHTPDFDPDDIEIVDGLSKISYGSDPHLTFLKAPGEPVTSPREIPHAPNPTRMLLLYAFPEGSSTFTLYYWGKNLLNEPMEFEESGWGLPFPEKVE